MIVAIGIADGAGYLGALICDTAFGVRFRCRRLRVDRYHGARPASECES